MADQHGSEKQSWVRDLVRLHQSPLIRYARSIVRDEHAARDIVQETFLQLCKQSPEGLSGREVAWLFRVCHNSALNRLRKERRMTHSTETAESAEISNDPSLAMAAQDDRSCVLRLIEELPENQQRVIRLRFHSGLAYRQISEATGLTEGNVGYLLHTALGKLREQMMRLET
ncbi:sigma-70 family RNA polymerase sigma factor [Stieleria sp. TO1_6]|uniref:RNA polymerase sigma factor n=1 Tax=Stieleria tagensis TaxID=2956795 RepID=UPI00209B03E6|nr:sigma-70 family RNA polymerase sigma factor [Stieleria tagensis]MCO8120163.1 sigma-70 family RNA polymerase sigma factor [Stieleria tagensis]